MLNTRLHARGWNRPYFILEIYFAPLGTERLAGSCRRKDRKLEGKNGGGACLKFSELH